MSDIHGNMAALNAVLEDSKGFDIDCCALLGDIIDYGMHSNEVIEIIRGLPYSKVCNIWGNHEYAIIKGDYSRFSSERGVNCARYTSTVLNDDSRGYIMTEMNESGKQEFTIDGLRFLSIHGDMTDPYWKSIDEETDAEPYSGYDYVLSGHSHLPHYFERYYKTKNENTRNKRKCTFINPGSVGQPRNIDPSAQYCILDTETRDIYFRKVDYDIGSEESAYNGQVDDFYRKRLRYGV